MSIRLENKPLERMVSYLEDDDILELLEKSEDDKRWSKEEQIESSDDDGEIDHLSVEELSSSDISDNEDQDTSIIFMYRNWKENWSATPIQITLAELLLVTYITTDQALHALQNCNAIQCLIHSDYFLEINCLKKFELDKC